MAWPAIPTANIKTEKRTGKWWPLKLIDQESPYSYNIQSSTSKNWRRKFQAIGFNYQRVIMNHESWIITSQGAHKLIEEKLYIHIIVGHKREHHVNHNIMACVCVCVCAKTVIAMPCHWQYDFCVSSCNTYISIDQSIHEHRERERKNSARSHIIIFAIWIGV